MSPNDFFFLLLLIRGSIWKHVFSFKINKFDISQPKKSLTDLCGVSVNELTWERDVIILYSLKNQYKCVCGSGQKQ